MSAEKKVPEDRRLTPQDRIIQVQHKQVYGAKDVFYPLNDTAIALCELMKQTTFTPENLKLLKTKLGFEIEAVVPGLEDIIGKGKK